MRRLMVKLVAIETAFVGWLGYWLFLVYSNNPLVSGGLVAQLSKFLQLSFTTVDITVLVLIGALSILLAFKFDRGLRPGIRLERALQMLESLMKRNLMLEAQVAEMKMASVQGTTPDSQSTDEAPLGSWERAFRTPIEAGPPTGLQSTTRSSRNSGSQIPSRQPTAQRFRPTKIETRQPQAPMTTPEQFNEGKHFDADSSTESEIVAEPKQSPSLEPASAWTSFSESTSGNQPTTAPAGTPRKPIAIAHPVSRRQPYIPVPAAKAVLPSVPPSRNVSPVSRARSGSRSGPGNSPSEDLERINSSPSSLASTYHSSESPSQYTSSNSEITRSALPESNLGQTDNTPKNDETQSTPRTTMRASTSEKKRFPWEDT